MDGTETKTCTNCKREIPAVNFTIHTVHCARNIRMCPVCKEPVLQSELEEHHEKLHKLLPCQKCGESVCGTDLEDHVRDSCAHTIKSCRYCELELSRGELPAHEGYCGVRTEQCAACREWVMLKYRQLHHDSNHGFLRLHDDPVPQPKKEAVKPRAASNSSQWALPSTTHNGIKNTNLERSRPEMRPVRSEPVAGSSRTVVQKLPLKRTNDQPQINTTVTAPDKVNKELPLAQGAVKKRSAPQPPGSRRENHTQRQRDLGVNPQRGTTNSPVGGVVWNPLEKPERLRNLNTPQRAPSPRDEFRHISPMSPEEFMERLNALQVSGGGGADRFSEIKSSLRELRRGLNEVTAPYTASAVSDPASPVSDPASPVSDPAAAESPAGSDEEGVRLPCEFCGRAVPPALLVQHQTGCRPDLARYKSPARRRRHTREDVTVIPCEFCSQSLPVYLISEHQERCRREGHMLYAD